MSIETRAAERLQERAANHSPFTQQISPDVGADPGVVAMISLPVMFRTEDDLISAMSCAYHGTLHVHLIIKEKTRQNGQGGKISAIGYGSFAQPSRA